MLYLLLVIILMCRRKLPLVTESNSEKMLEKISGYLRRKQNSK